jgi:hypothetical protein
MPCLACPGVRAHGTWEEVFSGPSQPNPPTSSSPCHAHVASTFCGFQSTIHTAGPPASCSCWALESPSCVSLFNPRACHGWYCALSLPCPGNYRAGVSERFPSLSPASFPKNVCKESQPRLLWEPTLFNLICLKRSEKVQGPPWAGMKHDRSLETWQGCSGSQLWHWAYLAQASSCPDAIPWS